MEVRTITPVVTPTPVIPPDDDHGNSISSATAIPTDKSEVGKINYGGDVDFFSFAAEQGTAYILETFLTSLADSRLFLYDSGGRQIVVNDIWDDRKGSRVLWTTQNSGTYYVKVTAKDNSQTGGYGLTVSVDRR